MAKNRDFIGYLLVKNPSGSGFRDVVYLHMGKCEGKKRPESRGNMTKVARYVAELYGESWKDHIDYANLPTSLYDHEEYQEFTETHQKLFEGSVSKSLEDLLKEKKPTTKQSTLHFY